MDDERQIGFRLNGVEQRARVPVRLHLVDFLRSEYELASPRVGCEHGVCGACTIRVDGEIVRGCLVLAAQLDGCAVETIEGLSDAGTIRDLQDAFVARNALQCGFCTPGMLVAAADLVERRPTLDREAIREHLSGNYCRCTGYQAIVDVVATVCANRLGRKDAAE
jgi:carbon-monoxide dehydrogenase small subunit